MTENTTQAHLDDHPAWSDTESEEEPTAAVAQALAEQVCMVVPERDWLLINCANSTRALWDVWVPAVGALYAWWIEDLDLERGANGEQTQARREAFAALAACAGYVAWTCGDFSLARVLAHRARTTAPQSSSVSLAELVITGAVIGCRWEEMAEQAQQDCYQALAAHRKS